MVKTIIKRDGRTAEFHPQKIADAVEKSFQACAAMQDRATAEQIAATVVEKLESGAIEGTPTVEGVQDSRGGNPHRVRLRADRQGLHPLSRRAQPRA